MSESEKRCPRVGQSITYFDPKGRPVPALVLAVWTPGCINLVHVSEDAARQDSTGRQIERQTSQQHLHELQVHGGGWLFNDEQAPAFVPPKES